MNRMALLDIVRSNLEKHTTEYKEAVDGYRIEVLRVLKENARRAKMNTTAFEKDPTMKLSNLNAMLQMPTAPQTYEKEYGRAIRMLELSVDAEIDVEEDVFNQLVLDEWSWKQMFAATTSLYNKKG